MNEIQHIRKFEDLVYDVGMHKGEDTDFYLKKGFKVIGFEANPDLVAQCRNKFSNEIMNGKLIVVEGAIVALQPGETKIKKIKFFKNKNNSIWGTVAENWADRNEYMGTSNEIIEVPVIDFAECLKKYGVPHYLKIDIEGMDIVCLRSLRNVPKKPDYISIESEKVLYNKLLEEINLLTELGYSKFKAIQQRGISSQTEPNPSKEGCCVKHQFQEGSSGLFGEDLPHEWKSYKQILRKYKFIFIEYKLFGDYSKLRKYFVGKIFIKTLSLLLRKPLPGWYDTHAKHSSVVSDRPLYNATKE
jgi:FkbM family methyltransferase